MHYLVHKVSRAWVDRRGVLRFKYVDEEGQECRGPFFPDSVNGKAPRADEELAKSGLRSADEIKFVLAYHSGACPFGIPGLLLRSLEDIPARFKSAHKDDDTNS